MKGKELFDYYKIVNYLQGVAEDARKAAEMVKEAENELKKED